MGASRAILLQHALWPWNAFSRQWRPISPVLHILYGKPAFVHHRASFSACNSTNVACHKAVPTAVACQSPTTVRKRGVYFMWRGFLRDCARISTLSTFLCEFCTDSDARSKLPMGRAAPDAFVSAEIIRREFHCVAHTEVNKTSTTQRATMSLWRWRSHASLTVCVSPSVHLCLVGPALSSSSASCSWTSILVTRVTCASSTLAPLRR